MLFASLLLAIAGAAFAAPSPPPTLNDRTIAFPECAAACTLFCLTHGDAPCYAACIVVCAGTVEPGEPIESVEQVGDSLQFKTSKGISEGYAPMM